MMSNIFKLYIMRISLCAWAYIPTLLLFYQSHGLTVSDIICVKAFLSIIVVFLEVPSGYFADVYGRKLSLLSGGVLWLISLIIYMSSSTFLTFLVAEGILAFGVSLISGADSAITFDSLKSENKEHEYKKIEGRLIAFGGFSEAFFAIIGGLLAVKSLIYPFYLQIFLICIYILTALTLYEPKHFMNVQKASVGKLKDIFLSSLKQPLLRSLMIFYAFSAGGTFLAVWFAQAFMESIDLPVEAFGYVWAVLHVVLGISALFAEKVEAFLGKIVSIYSLAIILSVSYMMLAFSSTALGLIFIMLIYVVRGFRSPLLKDYVNQLVESEVRATMISIQSFMFRLVYFVISPFIAWVASNYGLQSAFIVTAIILIVPSLYAVYRIQVESKLES